MSGPLDEFLNYEAAGAVWRVRAKWVPGNVGVCRGCDARVLWVTTAAGKRMPLNVDGTSHFSDCPQAASFRRPRP